MYMIRICDRNGSHYSKTTFEDLAEAKREARKWAAIDDDHSADVVEPVSASDGIRVAEFAERGRSIDDCLGLILPIY